MKVFALALGVGVGVGVAMATWLSSGCVDAECGDGVVASIEGCDDGNTASGDGCDSLCYVEYGWDCSDGPCVTKCGDGIYVPGAEVCDPSTSQWEGYCTDDCGTVTGACGDGVLQSEVEDCDAGSSVLRGCNECTAALGFDCEGTPTVCTATGLPGNRMMNDLSSAELQTYCTWLVDLLGGPGVTYLCGTIQVTNNSVSTCVSELQSVYFGSCTVADVEDFIAEQSDACDVVLAGDPDCVQG